jgi:Ras-related GTP-binding protein A/B
LHSSNNPASLTSRLGATIDVEQNHVRFLGDLILNLWDCGGQDAFMDSYLSTQRSTIFQHVGVLIYVFEVSAHDAVKDAAYYRDCLDALQKYSPEAAVFLLVHKMDLVAGDRPALLERRTRELQAESGTVSITVFGTSIHDESLYKVCQRHNTFFLISSPTLCVLETHELRHGRASCTPSSRTRPSYQDT